MAEFLQKPILSEKEKEWVLNVAKPLLKKNDMVTVRKKLNSDTSSFSIGDNSKARIADFLLYYMGEVAYFKDSHFVLKREFFKDDNLYSIQIPSNVKVIGPSAFNSCGDMVEIDLPDGVDEIGVCAFSGCHKLQKIKIPPKLSVISDEMFYGCWDLPYRMDNSGRSIFDIPDTVKEIRRAAFSHCDFDTAVVPDGCKIHPLAFDGNVQIIRLRK